MATNIHGIGDASAQTVLSSHHVQAVQMGEHVREFRFTEPVVLQKVQILARNEKLHPDSSFEGISYPNFRTMSLAVFASDCNAAGSTMPQLHPGNAAGSFIPLKLLVTDCVVIRGEFLKLSVVFLGRMPVQGEATNVSEVRGVAAHLRPTSALDADKLDLADFAGLEGKDGDMEITLDNVALNELDLSAPKDLASSVALSDHLESQARVGQHFAWIASHNDFPSEDALLKVLHELRDDVHAISKGHHHATLQLASDGAGIARVMISLISRCHENLQCHPLRAALEALEASLCVASVAIGVLNEGGLSKLLGLLRDSDLCQISLKHATLRALLQLCSHPLGMESFIGWSTHVDPSQVPSVQGPLQINSAGYELVVALALDDTPGSARLAGLANMLLQRAAFYVSLARFDATCKDAAETDEGASPGYTLQAAVDLLTDIAEQLEKLSGAVRFNSATDATDSLLDDDCPKVWSKGHMDSQSRDEYFKSAHPCFHGFLESYIGGRRLLQGLCSLLRRLTDLPSQSKKLSAFAAARRLICAIISCVGGAQFMASDSHTLTTLLKLLDSIDLGIEPGGSCAKGARDTIASPSVPHYPEALATCCLEAKQLSALIGMHVRAVKIVFLLIARTRQGGRDGLLPEGIALPLLSVLHQLCARGEAGRAAVVRAFRSAFLIEWLLRQLDGRLEEASKSRAPAQAPSVLPPQPSVRHLIAVLHTLIVGDNSASVAEYCGLRVLTLAQRVLALLESVGNSTHVSDGWAACASLEFSLDSDGPEGGLGRAVHVGRRSADVACLRQIQEVISQLQPWQLVEGEQMLQADRVSVSKLLSSLQISGAPRAFKRSMNEEKGSRLSLLLGGYSGVDAGIEVAEVDYVGGDAGEQENLPDEKLPSGDLTELPIVAMRVLCRRAAVSARDALNIALGGDKRVGADTGSGKDGLAIFAPLLIRCASAINLNLEALMLQEDREFIDEVYATQTSHAQLLEAALQTCYHILKGLREAGLSQYRDTKLFHSLVLLSSRLTSSLVGITPDPLGIDQEFRHLWRSCLFWVCRVFRTWVQSFPKVTGGQLLRPLLRHVRILPSHFVPGLLMFSMCGELASVLPSIEHSFAITQGHRKTDTSTGEQCITSHPMLFPASIRGGVLSQAVLKVSERESPFSKSIQDRTRLWGQLWGTDSDMHDWEGQDLGPSCLRGIAVNSPDPLIRAFSRKPQTAVVASALGLVTQVNIRHERLSMDDIGEAVALVAQCSLTTDALLHLIVVRVMDKLEKINIPILSMVLRLGETALHGVGARTGSETDILASDSAAVVSNSTAGGSAAQSNSSGGTGAPAAGNATGGATAGTTLDPRDGRSVSRLLVLLTHFGRRSVVARRALVEQRTETLCLSVLAHTSPTLPAMAMTQAIRVLTIMFADGFSSEDLDMQVPVDTSMDKVSESPHSVSTGALTPSVPKCRIVSKALSYLLNRMPDEGNVVGPSAIAAALELLIRLSSVRSMCLNLLFSAGHDPSKEGAGMPSTPIPVTVSCAFRLTQCAQRLARELSSADEVWEATVPGSEGEADAEDSLSAWLRVGELLISLCETVLVHCPTASTFLAVMLPAGAPPERVDEPLLRSMLADVHSSLDRITNRRRTETVRMRAAGLVGNLRALRKQLLDAKPGPPPACIPREELCPLHQSTTTAPSGSDATMAGLSQAEDDDVLDDLVNIFNFASRLERSPEWHAVAELDAADAPNDTSGATWEFDAVVHRKRRQAANERLELERKAKRLKQSQRSERIDDRAPDRSLRRRSSEGDFGDKDRPFAASGQSSGVNTNVSVNASRKVPASTPGTSKGEPGAAEVATMVPKMTPPPGTPSSVVAASDPNGSPKDASSVVPVASTSGGSPLDAAKALLSDHPEFLRVLRNPKKTLSDPRKKAMFLSELEKYPAVKEFMKSRGLVTN